MLNEESKDRLIKAIFILKKEDEEIPDEDLKLAEELSKPLLLLCSPLSSTR